MSIERPESAPVLEDEEAAEPVGNRTATIFGIEREDKLTLGGGTNRPRLRDKLETGRQCPVGRLTEPEIDGELLDGPGPRAEEENGAENSNEESPYPCTSSTHSSLPRAPM